LVALEDGLLSAAPTKPASPKRKSAHGRMRWFIGLKVALANYAVKICETISPRRNPSTRPNQLAFLFTCNNPW
jgi:hypothetical protein